MSKLAKSIWTPAVHTAVEVKSKCGARNCARLELTHLNILKLNFAHIELLRTFDHSKLSCAPDNNLVLSIDGWRETTSDNFLSAMVVKRCNSHGRPEHFTPFWQSKLKVDVEASSVDFVFTGEHEDVAVTKADLDELFVALDPGWLSYISTLIWTNRKLSIFIATKCVEITFGGEEATHVFSTVNLEDRVFMVFQGFKQFEWRVQHFVLGNELATLTLRIAAPCKQRLVVSQDQVVVWAAAESPDAWVHRVSLDEEWCRREVELTVVDAELAVLVWANGEQAAALRQHERVAASTANLLDQDVKTQAFGHRNLRRPVLLLLCMPQLAMSVAPLREELRVPSRLSLVCCLCILAV